MLNKLIILMFLASSNISNAYAENGVGCKILDSVRYKNYLGKRASHVLDLDLNSGGDSSDFEFWIVESSGGGSKKIWEDGNIEAIVFIVAKNHFQKSVRGKVLQLTILAPKVFSDEKLYAQYFGSCGVGDIKTKGVKLSKDVSLSTPEDQYQSALISNETIYDELYREIYKRSVKRKFP